MIFGSRRDSNTLLHIGRELIADVITQECLIYKVCLENLNDNIYGEVEEKSFWTPLYLNCLIWRGDQDWSMKEFGTDLGRQTRFAFFKQDLVDTNVKPEIGDIIEWDKNYFEVDGIKENQYLVGKDAWYRLDDQDPDRTFKFGDSISIVCSTHLTRYKKLNLVQRN